MNLNNSNEKREGNKCKAISFSDISWTNLTDFQKSKLLLNNDRLLDQQQFVTDFESFEEPSVPEIQVNPVKKNATTSSQPTSSRHIKIDDCMLVAFIKSKLK